MDKKDYKLAYDYIYNLINLDDESMKWPLTIDSMAIFKELVDEKLNKPTLEEVKKEWEDLGYVCEEGACHLTLRYKRTNNIIHIWEDHTYRVDDWLTFQEHQLLTKTFRALGWDKENNNDK